MRKRKASGVAPPLEPVAGNGLLHRRALLGSGIVFAGALEHRRRADRRRRRTAHRAGLEPLSRRSHAGPADAVQYEKDVVRNLSNPKGEPRTQHARTPHQALNGTITPNALHFTILHSGIPDIDPGQHRLVIHGMVKQPLEYTVEDLLRYPMVTRKHFVECGGNSAPMFSNEPVQAPVRRCTASSPAPNGPACRSRSCSTKPAPIRSAKWMLAEGADSLAAQPQRADEEGLRRRHRRALPERRAHHARQRLSDAAPAARLRRQHEHQVPAPDQSHRSAGDDLSTRRATIRRCCRTAKPTDSTSSTR